MYYDKPEFGTTLTSIALTGFQVANHMSRGPINMSSELEDATVFANGTNDASLVTDSEETVREASVRNGDSSPFADARIRQGDRRKPSLKSFIRGAFYPRRRRIRRADDMDHTFLDYHPPYLLVVCTMILVLSVIDGFLAIYFANSGIKDVNPLMSALVSTDPVLFALAKVAFTTVGVIGLVLTAHMRIYRIVKAATVLNFFLFCYFVLVLYQLGLFLIIG